MARHTKRRRGKKRRKLSYAARHRARVRRMRSLGYRYVKSGGLKGRGRFLRRKKLTKRQIAARRTARQFGAAKLSAAFPAYAHVTEDGAMFRARFHKGQPVVVDGHIHGTVQYITADNWVGVRDDGPGHQTTHEWQANRVRAR